MVSYNKNNKSSFIHNQKGRKSFRSQEREERRPRTYPKKDKTKKYKHITII
jgi:hypothetical protein